MTKDRYFKMPFCWTTTLFLLPTKLSLQLSLTISSHLISHLRYGLINQAWSSFLKNLNLTFGDVFIFVSSSFTSSHFRSLFFLNKQLLSYQEGRAPVILSDNECYKTSIDIDVIMIPDSDISARECILQQFDKLILGEPIFY